MQFVLFKKNEFQCLNKLKKNSVKKLVIWGTYCWYTYLTTFKKFSDMFFLN